VVSAAGGPGNDAGARESEPCGGKVEAMPERNPQLWTCLEQRNSGAHSAQDALIAAGLGVEICIRLVAGISAEPPYQGTEYPGVGTSAGRCPNLSTRSLSYPRGVWGRSLPSFSEEG
jgi:hypothetical protein